ncbi:MAG: HupE/UreJ family protein [Paracoccaceae bacterium]
MIRIVQITLLCLLTVWAVGANAHETTRSYVTLNRTGPNIDLNIRVAFRDIEVAVWMDEDLDGKITWGETERRLDAVTAYIAAGLSIDAGGVCTLTRKAADNSVSGGIEYLDVSFAGTCPSASAPLTIATRLFTEIDPDHRMFVQSAMNGISTTTLLSRAEPSVTLSGETGGALASFVSYFKAGVEHLLAGADHILFLLMLILPAVCAPGSAKTAALRVVTAVTGFTLAHAVTLTAATTQLLRPPPDVINALIALSIAITAADNIRPFIPAPRAAVAAFFGIIHGFGFATALGALQLTGGSFVLALVGFNLGIEAAQIGLVLITMPALYMLAGGRFMLWFGSALAGAVALWWFWLRLMPFFPT